MDGVILYQVSSLQVVEGGPVITYGNIVREKDERKTRIAQYWTRRSDSFLEQRRAELHSALAGRWMAELKKYLPEKKNLRILDVGCGTGFFPILPRLTAYLHASFLREIRQSYTAPHSLRLPSSFPFFLPQFKNVKFILPSQTLLPRRNTFTSSRFQPWLQPHLLPGNTVPIHPC